MNVLRIACLALGAILSAAQPGRATFDPGTETPGSEPRALIPLVGAWQVVPEEGRRLLKLEGARAGRNLMEKARDLFGAGGADFLAGLRAHPDDPLAVAREPVSFEGGEINLRFKLLAGRKDQAAGILFGLQPSGDYLALRADALENNLMLLRVAKGRRRALAEVRNTPTAGGQWHALKLTLRDRVLRAFLDGAEVLEHTLDEPVAGRVGIASKGDSVVLFDQFTVRASP
jgi:hypothetical protein